MSNLFDICKNSVRLASYFCEEAFKQIESSRFIKQDLSPVTIADYGSQLIILNSLNQEKITVPMIAEETWESLKKHDEESDIISIIDSILKKINIKIEKNEYENIFHYQMPDEKSSTYFCLDPIDGTKGYLRGDQYAVALGLIKDGCAEMGILGCPRFGKYKKEMQGFIAYAQKGHGAFYSDGNLKNEKAAQCRKKNTFEDMIVLGSIEKSHGNLSFVDHLCLDMKLKNSPLRMDSQAKYVALGANVGDLYIRIPSDPQRKESIWDHAAGIAFNEEAGGKVTDLNGDKIKFFPHEKLDANIGIIASGFHDTKEIINYLQLRKKKVD